MSIEQIIYPLDSDLEPVITDKVYELLKVDREWQADEIARCGCEFWYWVVNYVLTVRKDEVRSYREHIPSKEYLRYIADFMMREPFLVVGKSRQLMVTWLAMCFAVWLGKWNKDMQIFCQQKKEEDADLEMIQRARFIDENMPVWMRDFNRGRYSYGEFKFAGTGSMLKAIPSGGDQIRSHNPNVLISDEIAFQERAEESYTNAQACCRRIILISTPNAGFFCDLVHDSL